MFKINIPMSTGILQFWDNRVDKARLGLQNKGCFLCFGFFFFCFFFFVVVALLFFFVCFLLCYGHIKL